MENTIVTKNDKYVKQSTTFIGIVCVVIIGVLVGVLYFPFLTGDKVFLFPNMVSDGINQFYPSYIESTRNFANGLTNFSVESGWGYVSSIKNPFEILIISFGEEHVAYMIGFGKCR